MNFNYVKFYLNKLAMLYLYEHGTVHVINGIHVLLFGKYSYIIRVDYELGNIINVSLLVNSMVSSFVTMIHMGSCLQTNLPLSTMYIYCIQSRLFSLLYM